MILAADAVEYASHRAYHEVPFLWRIHAIHHSPEAMDWLSGSRLHFLEPLVTRSVVLVPVFLLAEANLGVLGLGVAEPLPSLGNMLAELQNYERIPEEPWILAPAALLILVVGCLHFVLSGRRKWEQV